VSEPEQALIDAPPPQAMVAGAARSVEPFNAELALKDMARTLAQSSLIPDALRGKPADIWIVLMTGRELGLQPMRALQCIDVVKGKPVLSAELIVGIVKASPLCEYFDLIKSDGTVALYKTKRTDSPNEVELGFTIQEAEQAGLLKKDNWRGYAASMLRARAKKYLAREVYPEVVMGLAIEDEVPEILSNTAAAPTGSGVSGLKAKMQARAEAGNESE
jgi:hypothetical protein